MEMYQNAGWQARQYFKNQVCYVRYGRAHVRAVDKKDVICLQALKFRERNILNWSFDESVEFQGR